MIREERIGVWVPIGVFGAIALGVVLIPLRTLTSASNLAFAFLAFTILVSEMGGRVPALATATVSVMSLNFFLTEPYLTLIMSKTDDIVAFTALAACGLMAAAFGKRRAQLSELASRAGKELDVLKGLVGELGASAPLDRVLESLRRAFTLRALVVRDANGRALGTASAGPPPGDPPEARLKPDTLLAADEMGYRSGRRGFRLAEGGGRLSVGITRGSISVDMWEGDPEGLDLDQRRTLSIAASILALELCRPAQLSEKTS